MLNNIGLKNIKNDQQITTVYFVLAAISFAMVYFPLLDYVPLINEETRRALVAKELIQTEHYFYASIAGEAYTAKPLFFNWLIIASSYFTEGVTPLSARVPSLIGAGILILCLTLHTASWWSKKSALFFFIILALSPQIIRKATTAEIDMVFALWVNLSLFTWLFYYQKQQLNKAWIISALYIGLAYLCKREAALLFYLLSIFGFLIWQKKLKQGVSSGALIALCIIIAFIAVWLVPILTVYGSDIFISQTAIELKARSSNVGFATYLLTSAAYPFEVFIALLPSAFLLPVLLLKSCRNKLTEKFGLRFQFCLFVLIINIIPFILLGKSNVRYYLPMFPVAFILATMVFDQYLSLKLPEKWHHWLIKKLPLLTVSLLIVGIISVTFTKTLFDYTYIGFPISVMLLLLGGFRVLRKKDNKAEELHHFMIFCLLVCVAVRVVELSYTLPRQKVINDQYRNMPQILAKIENVAQGKNKKVVASPRLSHAVYFYDNVNLVTPMNCKNRLTHDHIVLGITANKNMNSQEFIAIKGNIIWQDHYRKNKTIYLYRPLNINAKPDYCG